MIFSYLFAKKTPLVKMAMSKDVYEQQKLDIDRAPSMTLANPAELTTGSSSGSAHSSDGEQLGQSTLAGRGQDETSILLACLYPSKLTTALKQRCANGTGKVWTALTPINASSAEGAPAVGEGSKVNAKPFEQ